MRGSGGRWGHVRSMAALPELWRHPSELPEAHGRRTGRRNRPGGPRRRGQILAVRPSGRIHDLTASVESIVAPTATRVFVIYKLNSAFSDVRSPMTTARFNVQVNQSLPFLDFTNAQWEMLMAVSNLFRNELMDASVYDEVMVIRAPKRVLGGVTVRF